VKAAEYLRLRCDRALPACSNCLNRDEIGACSYVSRRPKEAPKSQDPQQDTKHLQNKIDRLEQLVLNFIGDNGDPRRLIPGGSSDGGMPIAQQKPEQTGELSDDEDEIETEVQIAAVSSPKELSVVSKSSMMKIHADYRQSHAIDEAHWAQLLNEVRSVSVLKIKLTSS
jgi:hypothetical protein